MSDYRHQHAIATLRGLSNTQTFLDEVSRLTALKPGDRVEIREGYEEAGEVLYYTGKSSQNPELVSVKYGEDDPFGRYILAAAIKPKPYTRREKAEKAADEFLADHFPTSADMLREPLIELLERGL